MFWWKLCYFLVQKMKKSTTYEHSETTVLNEQGFLHDCISKQLHIPQSTIQAIRKVAKLDMTFLFCVNITSHRHWEMLMFNRCNLKCKISNDSIFWNAHSVIQAIVKSSSKWSHDCMIVQATAKMTAHSLNDRTNNRTFLLRQHKWLHVILYDRKFLWMTTSSLEQRQLLLQKNDRMVIII